MPRIILSLSSAAVLLAATLTSAGAQTVSTASAQTLVSPNGYQFQVPADWQSIPTSTQQHMGTQTVKMDSEVASADGTGHAHVEALSGFGIGASDLQGFLASFFGPPASAASTTSPAPFLSQPKAVQVAGADAAEEGAAGYTDPSGNQRIVAIRVAIQGQTVYVLTMDVPQAFYQSDSSFGQIMGSFQLTPSATAAAGS